MKYLGALISADKNSTLTFGNDQLAAKAKLDGFEFGGDLYKIKTYREITKLERNGILVYESNPGTVVKGFEARDDEVSFTVYGTCDTQIVLGLEEECEYDVYLNKVQIDRLKTNLGGKLAISVTLKEDEACHVRVVKVS